MTTLLQADLPQDHGILRTAAQHNPPFVAALGSAVPSVGVYANQVAPRYSSALQAEPNRILGKPCASRAGELIFFDRRFDDPIFK